ncbi:hypothetical protein QUB28_21560 [Microcoleus sp. B4-C3]
MMFRITVALAGVRMSKISSMLIRDIGEPAPIQPSAWCADGRAGECY